MTLQIPTPGVDHSRKTVTPEATVSRSVPSPRLVRVHQRIHREGEKSFGATVWTLLGN